MADTLEKTINAIAIIWVAIVVLACLGILACSPNANGLLLSGIVFLLGGGLEIVGLVFFGKTEKGQKNASRDEENNEPIEPQ